MSALPTLAFLVCGVPLLVCFAVVAFVLHNAPMDPDRDKRER